MRTNQRALILGATGSIGGAVAEVLRERGHAVTCLARSDRSEADLRALGFDILRGDIRFPDKWIDCADRFDAVIHAAATWSDDMAEIDQNLTEKLLQAFATDRADKTIIYTDGCWSYGETGDEIATEDTAFNPLSEFTRSVDTTLRVKESGKVRGMVIFPAMVYERDGGVLEAMTADAREREHIRVVGHERVRWPLVHRVDLAELYALMLERGKQGASYNAAGIVSMEVGKIARALAKRYGKSTCLEALPVDQAVRELGSWAKGFALDQQMSSARAMAELGWSPTHTDILSELS